MEDCLFCKFIKKEIDVSPVYEDKKTFVILDISPASPNGGHMLAMPKNHYELISDMTDEDSAAVMFTIKKISKALLKFGDGMNVLQNNKKAAGQYIPHVHFHLIPRFKNDGITIEKWTANKYGSEEEMHKIKEKIRKLLKD